MRVFTLVGCKMRNFLDKARQHGLWMEDPPYRSPVQLLDSFWNVVNGRPNTPFQPTPIPKLSSPPKPLPANEEPRWIFNAVHLYGSLLGMSTEDVLKYFSMFKPVFVDWIDDTCCLVYFKTEMLAIDAMMQLSTQTEEGALTRPLNATAACMNWRLGAPYRTSKNSYFLMRFAIEQDSVSGRKPIDEHLQDYVPKQVRKEPKKPKHGHPKRQNKDSSKTNNAKVASLKQPNKKPNWQKEADKKKSKGKKPQKLSNTEKKVMNSLDKLAL
jgi:hypothetical protein